MTDFMQLLPVQEQAEVNKAKPKKHHHCEVDLLLSFMIVQRLLSLEETPKLIKSRMEYILLKLSAG